MARMVAVTQYRENYGTESTPFWKNKGANEYALNLDDAQFAAMSDADVAALRGKLTAKVSYANAMCTEHVVDIGIYPTGCKTPEEADFERMLADGYAEEKERQYFTPKVVQLEH